MLCTYVYFLFVVFIGKIQSDKLLLVTSKVCFILVTFGASYCLIIVSIYLINCCLFLNHWDMKRNSRHYAMLMISSMSKTKSSNSLNSGICGLLLAVSQYLSMSA